VGVAGGRGKGILFKKGERVAKLSEADLLPRLLAEVAAMTGENVCEA
jgi:(E)-4-hydroxy-3-methylbut-2-enyl-diphosphate synthase